MGETKNSSGSEIPGKLQPLNQPIREQRRRQGLNTGVGQISVFLLIVITVKPLLEV